MWSTGEGNSKPLQDSCLESPMNSMKRQNDRIPKVELLRSVGAQHATRDQWRNNSRKNEGMEPKQKQYPGVGPAEALQVILTVVKFETQQDVQGHSRYYRHLAWESEVWCRCLGYRSPGKSLKLSAPSIFLPEGDNRACGSDLAGFF